MNVLITLTNPGANTGPFNIYTNVDNYITAVATNIAKPDLVSGYNVTVPPTAVTVKVESTGNCGTSIFLPIVQPTTTTTTSTSSTTTSTTTAVPTTTTTTTAGPAPTTTTTTTAAPPIPTTTTTTTPIPHYNYNFQVRNQTDTGYGDGTFTLNPTGGSQTFTTEYNLDLPGVTQFNPSGSTFVSNSGYVIDKIVRYNYNGTEAASALIGTANYTFGTGPFIMNSTGTSPGQYQTIKVFTKPAP